jgi:hypothetical protein
MIRGVPCRLSSCSEHVSWGARRADRVSLVPQQDTDLARYVLAQGARRKIPSLAKERAYPLTDSLCVSSCTKGTQDNVPSLGLLRMLSKMAR